MTTEGNTKNWNDQKMVSIALVDLMRESPEDPQQIGVLVGNSERREEYGKIARVIDSRIFAYALRNEERIAELERELSIMRWFWGIAGALIILRYLVLPL